MGSVFFISLLAALVTCIVVFMTGPRLCWADYRSPLNFIMFQQPKTGYTDQLVNQWIPKPWRMDGTRIPSRIEFGYPENVPNQDRLLILYSHGNAEDLLKCMQFMRNITDELDADVMTWDYSGYGLNEADSFERSAEGVNLSLATVIKYMTEEKNYCMSNIVLWGYSLGSGPTLRAAADLCQKQQPPKAVILLGPYSSILDMIKEKTSESVATWFSERWDNKNSIAQVTCPILIMHGQSDGLIPHHHSKKLVGVQPAAKLVLLPNTGHTQFLWPEVIQQVRTWV